ncbi:hypothetical protein C8J56DRAFT_1092710 [Mycena floridula]|nr:hypothetical protein C8J56DRAFT_1092710 [Mycena floridula]
MYSFNKLLAFVALTAIPTFVLGEPGVHCGTTSDATLSDCQALVDPNTWNSAWASGNNVCHYTNPISVEIDAEAFNVACHGNCCVYVARVAAADLDGKKEQIRNEAAGLFGCGDPSVDKVNAMQEFDDKHGTCISNGDGCGDCFDDADFA